MAKYTNYSQEIIGEDRANKLYKLLAEINETWIFKHSTDMHNGWKYQYAIWKAAERTAKDKDLVYYAKQEAEPFKYNNFLKDFTGSSRWTRIRKVLEYTGEIWLAADLTKTANEEQMFKAWRETLEG